MTCPFCQIPPERILVQNEYAFAIRDAFPVSSGHTLIISKRHVGSFFETTKEEKIALLELLENVGVLLAAPDVQDKPYGYNKS